jgi:hypothetical protein
LWQLVGVNVVTVRSLINFFFSPRQPNSDIIIGWVDDDGTVQITDRYAEDYHPPRLDKIQRLQNIAGSINDAFVTIEFTRPRLVRTGL